MPVSRYKSATCHKRQPVPKSRHVLLIYNTSKQFLKLENASHLYHILKIVPYFSKTWKFLMIWFVHMLGINQMQWKEKAQFWKLNTTLYRGTVGPIWTLNAKPRLGLMHLNRFDDIQNSFSEHTVYWH